MDTSKTVNNVEPATEAAVLETRAFENLVPYRCSYCEDRTFSSRDVLDSHLAEQHALCSCRACQQARLLNQSNCKCRECAVERLRNGGCKTGDAAPDSISKEAAALCAIEAAADSADEADAATSGAGKVVVKKEKNIDTWRQCQLCEHRFRNATLVAKHVAERHDKTLRFQCAEPKCGWTYAKRNNWAVHKRFSGHKEVIERREKSSTPDPDSTPPRRPKKQAMRKDTDQVSGKSGEKTSRAVSSSSTDSPKRRGRKRMVVDETSVALPIYQCLECPYNSRMQITINYHLCSAHADWLPYRCFDCQQRFANRYYVKTHCAKTGHDFEKSNVFELPTDKRQREIMGMFRIDDGANTAAESIATPDRASQPESSASQEESDQSATVNANGRTKSGRGRKSTNKRQKSKSAEAGAAPESANGQIASQPNGIAHDAVVAASNAVPSSTSETTPKVPSTPIEANQSEPAPPVLKRPIVDATFECLMCAYRTKSDHMMKVHICGHAFWKPFECATSSCKLRFAQASDLRQHVAATKHLDRISSNLPTTAEYSEIMQRYHEVDTSDPLPTKFPFKLLLPTDFTVAETPQPMNSASNKTVNQTPTPKITKAKRPAKARAANQSQAARHNAKSTAPSAAANAARLAGATGPTALTPRFNKGRSTKANAPGRTIPSSHIRPTTIAPLNVSVGRTSPTTATNSTIAKEVRVVAPFVTQRAQPIAQSHKTTTNNGGSERGTISRNSIAQPTAAPVGSRVKLPSDSGREVSKGVVEEAYRKGWYPYKCPTCHKGCYTETKMVSHCNLTGHPKMKPWRPIPVPSNLKQRRAVPSGNTVHALPPITSVARSPNTPSPAHFSETPATHGSAPARAAYNQASYQVPHQPPGGMAAPRFYRDALLPNTAGSSRSSVGASSGIVTSTSFDDSGSGNFVCLCCGMTDIYEATRNHILLMHLDFSPFGCTTCMEVFPVRAALEIHTLHVHRGSVHGPGLRLIPSNIANDLHRIMRGPIACNDGTIYGTEYICVTGSDCEAKFASLEMMAEHARLMRHKSYSIIESAADITTQNYVPAGTGINSAPEMSNERITFNLPFPQLPDNTSSSMTFTM